MGVQKHCGDLVDIPSFLDQCDLFVTCGQTHRGHSRMVWIYASSFAINTHFDKCRKLLKMGNDIGCLERLLISLPLKDYFQLLWQRLNYETDFPTKWFNNMDIFLAVKTVSTVCNYIVIDWGLISFSFSWCFLTISAPFSSLKEDTRGQLITVYIYLSLFSRVTQKHLYVSD